MTSEITRRKAIEFLKINRYRFGFERFIDMFGFSDCDFIAYINGKKYRFKVVYDVCEIRDEFLEFQIPKESIKRIVYGEKRFIETKSGKIDVNDMFVWVGKKFVNVYNFKKFDGIVYFESSNEKWERIAETKYYTIRLDYSIVNKIDLKEVDYKSISKFLSFLVRGNFYWETRFIREKVISDKFHSSLLEIFEHLSKFRLDEADFYIGINPRSEKIRKKEGVKFGNVIFVDFDSEMAKNDIDFLVEKFSNLGLEPSLAGISGKGAHFYWKLDNLIEAKKWEKLQKSFVEWVNKNFKDYEPDRLVDRTRISRILGTFNYKSKLPSRVVYASEKTYSPEYLFKYKAKLFKIV